VLKICCDLLEEGDSEEEGNLRIFMLENDIISDFTCFIRSSSTNYL